MKSDMVHMSDLMWYIHLCNITLNLDFFREFTRELPHIHSTLGHPEEYADNKEARKAEKKEEATRLEKWDFLARPLMQELQAAVSLQPDVASSSFVPSSFVEKRTVDEQKDAQRAARQRRRAEPPGGTKAAKSGQHALVDAPYPGEKVNDWTKGFWTMCYPELFPFGGGDFNADRERHVPFWGWLRWALRQDCGVVTGGVPVPQPVDIKEHLEAAENAHDSIL